MYPKVASLIFFRMSPGLRFKRLRLSKGFGQDALARAAGMRTNQGISQFELGKTKAMQITNWSAIAGVFGLTVDGLNAVVYVNDLQNQPDSPSMSDPSQTKTENRMRLIPVGRKFPAVVSLGIAASGWVELDELPLAPDGVVDRDTPIIVQVRGDSMEPRFRDGQHVMFKMLNPEDEAPVAGVDYVFIRSDNHGTFKRLERVTADGYELRALNPKYKKPLHVSKDEVVMVGEARFIVSDIPD